MTPITQTIRAWSRASDYVITSMIEMNRATFAALSVDDSDDIAPSRVPSTSENRRWSYERTVDEVDSIAVGDIVRFSKSISEDDVRVFAHASGDTNRLHVEDSFATKTRFGEQIVHGTLVAGLISAALARLPGVTVYLSQNLEFLAPAYVGDQLTATVEIVESLGGGRYRLETVVETDDELVIDGEAVVLIDPLPEGTE